MSLKKFKEILKNLNYSNSFKPTETSRILIMVLQRN